LTLNPVTIFQVLPTKFLTIRSEIFETGFQFRRLTKIFLKRSRDSASIFVINTEKQPATMAASLTTIFLSSFSCWCCCQLLYAQVTDTIKPGSVILVSSGEIVSANGKFQLSFSKGLEGLSYLGIIYRPNHFNTWLAHRGTPIASGNLTMGEDGVLKILHDGGSPILLNANSSAPNAIATIENSGNFRVKQMNPDGSIKKVLWQSFDYPTDTLLPGMKLGMDFKTKRKLMLNSWLTDQIPTSQGGFSLEWSPAANGTGQLIMNHRGHPYWVSGIGNDSHFPNFPIKFGVDYNFIFVTTDNESYFMYSIPDGHAYDSMWVLWSDGGLIDGGLIDQGNSFLLDSNMCFFNSSYHGCVEQNATKCSSANQQFDQKKGSFHRQAYRMDYNSSISTSDCWDQCLSDCSCIGFSTQSKLEIGCRFYNSEFVEKENGHQEKFFVRETENVVARETRKKASFTISSSHFHLFFIGLVQFETRKLILNIAKD
jgi:hypothetical protein